ncbi:MAG: polymer-forming cytoskeletal protein [candidate division WOR-3 bacterium]|nr:polymer-forming cytoskeletal protein [candidate division WOR-3 bacterium]MDW8150738.1 polymer-forming cytoskeletal protein [candidate division WOR-3 bacterium]
MILVISFLNIYDTTGSLKISDEFAIIHGKVNGDISLLNGSILLTDSGYINGNIEFFGDSLILQGRVNGYVSFIGKKVNISGRLVGDVLLIGYDVIIDSSGYINGNADIVAINYEDNGKITGEKRLISVGALLQILEKREKAEIAKDANKNPIAHIITLLIFFIITFITFLFIKNLIPNLLEKFYENPTRTVIIGLIFSLLVVPILILLIISIIGILLIPLYLIFIAAFTISSIAVGLTFVGKTISKNLGIKDNLWAYYFIGVFMTILFYVLHITFNLINLDWLGFTLLGSYAGILIIIGLGSLSRAAFKI